MHGQYVGILVLILLAAGICAIMVTGSWLLGPKKVTPYKSSPYECGVAPAGSARERFPIKFYLVAIVFILFDIEVVFLWSWMTVFRHSDRAFIVFSFFEFLVYMVTWILAYVYMIRVGAIDWDETTSLEPSKLGDEALQKAEIGSIPAMQPTGGQ
ncbi:MAG TPA: NADH-quinone oxidoreductase subunit A [Fimbriimonadaceae bacterium]|nr:NADH-quinone oxidoreductase subunit A [Fimbriimonadaceae bacterium]